MPANWIVLSAQGDRCPLTTGLRNARHDMPFQHASRRADAGLRKGFRIAQLRGGSQSILTQRPPQFALTSSLRPWGALVDRGRPFRLREAASS